MSKIEHWIGGKEDDREGIVRNLRWPIPAGVAQAYVDAYSEPGTVVLVPYCQGPSAVREIMAAGRKALALNFDPLSAFVVEGALAPAPAREVDAAVARLGDSLKQEVPLRRYLSELYATTCPACARPAVADFFVWDRDLGAPVAKHVRCKDCTWNARSGMEARDWDRLKEVPTQGMHYHYILDRIAPQPGVAALRTRLEYLLELYSPRNLYALAELTLRIESMFPSGPARRALKVMLLECLERCSSLAPLPGRRSRRRGLSRPGRYLERNVWHAFAEAASRYGQGAASLSGLVGSPEELVSGEGGRGFVGQGLVRDACRVLPPRSVDLILASPPALDASAWSLSYLWAAWLLGAEAAAPLQSLLRQRTPDPEWYARGMSRALASLVDLLRDDGRLVFVLTEQRPVVVEALALAAGRARLGVTALLQRGSDYRLELAPTLETIQRSPTSVADRIRQIATSAACESIRKRGEPVPWRTIHAAILRQLADSGLLRAVQEEETGGKSPIDLMAEQIQAGLEAPVFRRFVGDEGRQRLWWLAAPSDMAPPLCDRVERAGYRVLRDALALAEAGFAEAIYAQFPDPLTPPPALVESCLQAYGQELTPGFWQMRTEDLPDARRAEREALIEDLTALGQRLGFHVEPQVPFDVAWYEKGQPRAAFAVRWQAAVDEVLAFGAPRAPAIPYMVIPGGRAALVSYKLAHNPLWQEQVDKEGWRFIKYRHVRQLVARSEIDEYALQTVIGLDPIVEKEQAQLPLF